MPLPCLFNAISSFRLAPLPLAAWADLRAKLYLDAPSTYAYLRGGQAFTVDGINDGKLMRGLCKAMHSLKIGAAQQMEVFQIVAGVLQLGNTKFHALTGRYRCRLGGSKRGSIIACDAMRC